MSSTLDQIANTTLEVAANRTETRDGIDLIRLSLITMSLTMAAALLGNTFLITIISLIAKGKGVNSIQILLLNNCVADILYALVTILPTCVEMMLTPSYPGTDVTCRLVAYFRVVPMYSSPFLMVAISADRYFAICWPLYNMTRSASYKSSQYAGWAWLLALVLCTPNLAIYQLYSPKSGFTFCMEKITLWQKQTYVIFFVTMAWLLPSLLSAGLYGRVCYYVWSELTGVTNKISRPELHKESIDRTGGNYPTLTAGLRSTLNAVCVKQVQELENQKLQTLKLTSTVVAAHFLLYAPFCITNLLYAFAPHGSFSPVVPTLLMLCGNLNSCINPWIYIFFQWKQVKSVLRRVCGGSDGHGRQLNNKHSRTAQSMMIPGGHRRETGTSERLLSSRCSEGMAMRPLMPLRNERNTYREKPKAKSIAFDNPQIHRTPIFDNIVFL